MDLKIVSAELGGPNWGFVGIERKKEETARAIPSF
jgi:hypothetical protein